MVERFYSLSPVLMGAVLFVILLAGVQIGFGIGKRQAHLIDDRVRGVHLTLQAAMLGLLALLLGFSFAMAGARYEARKQQVIAESNAIGTLYLRASILPAHERAAVEQLIRRYVESRLDLYRAGTDIAAGEAAVGRSEAIQRELWNHADQIAEDSPNGAVNALFITALGQVIDVHATRIAALRDHVPEVILVLLVAYSTLSVGSMGYVYGLAGKRQMLMKVVFALLIVLVIMVIIDLDSPRSGLIRVSQQAMLDVQKMVGK